MYFDLDYAGNPGNIAAELFCNGDPIASIDSLKDGKAARKWAEAQAALHKKQNTPDESGYERTTVRGELSFSL